MIRRIIHPNSRKWNDPKRGTKAYYDPNRKETYERCAICDALPSPSLKVFIDRDTGKPICKLCFKIAVSADNELLNDEFNEEVKLLTDEEILDGLEE